MWWFSSTHAQHHHRWFTFPSQNLISTQTYLNQTSQQQENGTTWPLLSAQISIKDKNMDYIRTLYGQKLYCKPFDFDDGDDCVNPIDIHAATPGRCILEEHIFESYYRQRGDIPLDEIFALYHSTNSSSSSTTVKTGPIPHSKQKIDEELKLPTLKSIEPTRNLIKHGIELLQQYQQQQKTQKQSSSSSSSNSISEADSALLEFMQYYSTIPDWVNAQQIKRGQRILTTYLPAIGATLYYRSLVPGFSIPKIAAVLLSTGYLAPPASQQQVQNRLLDTGAFIAAISALTADGNNDTDTNTMTDSLPLLEPYSEIWKTILNVRVLHAKVRYALLQRKGSKQWNTTQYGIPINQEDLAATLLAFSYNALLGIEFLLGCPLSDSDQLDYLHFWRYVGWLLGIETLHDTQYLTTFCTPGASETTLKYPPLDPCGPGWIMNRPNPLEHSYAMFASILLHLSKPDNTSVEVAHHLLQLGGRSSNPNAILEKRRMSHVEKIKNIDGEPKKNTMWFYFRSYQCRRFIGHELANALLLPLHPIWYKRWQLHFYSTAYLLFLRLYTWASVPRSPFRTIIFKWHQQHLTSFFKNWSSKFVTNAKPSDKSTHFSSASTPPDVGTSEGSDEQGSSCPFAMIAPPNY